MNALLLSLTIMTCGGWMIAEIRRRRRVKNESGLWHSWVAKESTLEWMNEMWGRAVKEWGIDPFLPPSIHSLWISYHIAIEHNRHSIAECTYITNHSSTEWLSFPPSSAYRGGITSPGMCWRRCLFSISNHSFLDLYILWNSEALSNYSDSIPLDWLISIDDAEYNTSNPFFLLFIQGAAAETCFTVPSVIHSFIGENWDRLRPRHTPNANLWREHIPIFFFGGGGGVCKWCCSWWTNYEHNKILSFRLTLHFRGWS